GMDEVVRADLSRNVFVELARELVEVVVDVHLRPVPDGPRFDVDHARVLAELLDARVVPLAPAREDVHLDTTLAECARDLAHVDVHAAGVATAELRERARVDREHRDAARHGSGASSRPSQRSFPPRSYLYGSSPRRRS